MVMFIVICKLIGSTGHLDCLECFVALARLCSAGRSSGGKSSIIIFSTTSSTIAMAGLKRSADADVLFLQ